jgi:hypothetical protein
VRESTSEALSMPYLQALFCVLSQSLESFIMRQSELSRWPPQVGTRGEKTSCLLHSGIVQVVRVSRPQSKTYRWLFVLFCLRKDLTL